MANDDLSLRMKSRYEDRFRVLLPRRAYTLIRVDGRAFHTYLRDRARPFDATVFDSMNAAARALFAQADGAFLGFMQSDEVSLACQDFDADNTEAWFDGNVQKIASVSAGIATAAFIDAELSKYYIAGRLPHFDGRCWSMADPVEVANYFVSRARDCERNAIMMAAQARWSHAELRGVSTKELSGRLADVGFDWTQAPDGARFGRIVHRDGEVAVSPLQAKFSFERAFSHVPAIRPAVPVPNPLAPETPPQ